MKIPLPKNLNLKSRLRKIRLIEPLGAKPLEARANPRVKLSSKFVLTSFSDFKSFYIFRKHLCHIVIYLTHSHTYAHKLTHTLSHTEKTIYNFIFLKN